MCHRLIACMVLIAAWTDVVAQSSPPAEPANRPSARSEILRAFRKDISVCKSITTVLKADRSFVDKFISFKNRQVKAVEAFLRESPSSDSPDFQYVLRNAEYFDIEVSMHGHAWAVAWVEGEGIYCALTYNRLRAVEALGESPQAWEIRKFFLDKALQGMEHPSDEMSDGLVDFEQFKSLVLDADKLYSGPQRSKFIAWIGTAINAIDSSRKRVVDGAAGLSASEQNKVLDDRIAFLRGLANG
jgi:hypothetical protein